MTQIEMGSSDFSPSESLEKPKFVKLAVHLLWASLVFSLFLSVRIVLEEVSNSADKANALAAILLGIFLAILLPSLLIWKINSGKNWARWAFLVFSFVSVPTFFNACSFFLAFLFMLLTVIPLALLLFFPSSNRWFLPDSPAKPWSILLFGLSILSNIGALALVINVVSLILRGVHEFSSVFFILGALGIGIFTTIFIWMPSSFLFRRDQHPRDGITIILCWSTLALLCIGFILVSVS